MDCLNLVRDLGNSLARWRVRVSLRGSYEADIEVDNSLNQFQISDFLFKPIEVKLNSKTTVDGIIFENCADGDITWIKGLITHVDENTQLTKNTLVLRVQSFASRLARKAVNTPEFSSSATINMSMDFIVEYLGGLPTDLFDFESTPNITARIISGDNMIEELRKLSAAAEQDLYTNRAGVLVTRAWKDHRDAVDLVIPPEFIMQTERNKNIDSFPSVVMVRGRYFSQRERGRPEQQPLSHNALQSGKRGNVKHCAAAAIPRETMNLVLNMLNPDVIPSTDVELSGGTLTKSTLNVREEAHVGLKIKGPVGGFFTAGEHPIEISAKATVEDPEEIHGALAEIKDRENAKDEPDLITFAHELMSRLGPFIGRGQLGGARGGRRRKNISMAKDEIIEIRINMDVKDSQLEAEFGYVTDEIDNEYIENKETLFDIGVRHFQEYKMLRNTWAVKTAYLPCVDVGMKVTFTTPLGEEITGIISEIELVYEVRTLAMTLTVESTEELGNTDYQSKNLFFDHKPISAESDFWTVFHGLGLILIRPGASLTYTHIGTDNVSYVEQLFLMEPGETYTVSLVIAIGGGTFQLTVRDGGGPYVTETVSTSGTVQRTFSPTSVLNAIRFTHEGSLGQTCAIGKFLLIKKVTR